MSSRAKSDAAGIVNWFGCHKFVSYSLLFLVMLVLMHARHIHWGTGLIWHIDGVEQQYPFFIAEGRWLRELAESVLSAQPMIPQWTMDTGYGADYLGVLLPSLGNPFNLLSAFATPESAEIVLTIDVILQIYIAGILFIGYCSFRQFDGFSSVIGSVIYVFSGYTVLMFSQLFMLYPLVLGPLVLWGIDRVFDKGSPVLFIISQALCALYSVTLVYSVNLLLLAYCIIRYCLLDEKKNLAGFAAWFFRILGCVALGVFVAGILVVPSVMMLMGQGRLGLERPLDLFYSANYYLDTISGFLYPVSVGADCFYGYAPIAAIGVIALLVTMRKGEKTSIAIIAMLVLMVIILLLPPLGRLFNGLAYPNNRWVWALSLAVGLTAVYTLPKIERMDIFRYRIFIGVCILFVVVEVAILRERFSPYFFAALSIFVLLLIAYIALVRSKRIALWRIVVMVSLPLWCGSVFWFWSFLLPSEDMDWGATYEVIESGSPAKMLFDIDMDEGESFHYDGSGFDNRRNACLALGIPGSSFYSSYYNSLIDEYHASLGLTSSDLNFSYLNLQGRTALEALAGVKYFLEVNGRTEKTPSLFSDVIDHASGDTADFNLLEASASLPISFRYDQTLSAYSFDNLSMIQRQEALLQGMVVEDGGVDALSLDYSMLVLPEWNGPLSVEGGQFEISDAGESIFIDASIPAGKVAYLEFEDFACDDWANNGAGNVYLTFASGGVYEGVLQYYPSSHLYAGKDDWAISLGKVGYDRQGVEIRFSSPGTYRYSAFRIVLEDDTAAAGLVEELAAGAYRDVRYGGNGVGGAVDMGGSGGYVYFRIPYSRGWEAAVDGSPVSIEHANTAFMAIRVDAGVHDIRLQYSTPGLGAGAVATAIGVLCTTIVGCAHRRKSRKRKQ